jgi:hypothetical protein
MLQLTECNVHFTVPVNIDHLNVKLLNMNTAKSDFATVCQTASFLLLDLSAACGNRRTQTDESCRRLNLAFDKLTTKQRNQHSVG